MSDGNTGDIRSRIFSGLSRQKDAADRYAQTPWRIFHIQAGTPPKLHRRKYIGRRRSDVGSEISADRNISEWEEGAIAARIIGSSARRIRSDRGFPLRRVAPFTTPGSSHPTDY